MSTGEADKAEVYVFSRIQPIPNFCHSRRPVEKQKHQVTKMRPDKDKYMWSAGVQLVNYVSDEGDSLQGIVPACRI